MANKRSNNKDLLSDPVIWVALILAAVVLITVVVYFILKGDPENEDVTPSSTTSSTMGNLEPSEDDAPVAVSLGHGLVLTELRSYSGKYMEDGTNGDVSNVMMLIVKNTNAQDLQLARVQVEYEDFTAEFQITNLPAGESVVALELNKHAFVKDDYKSVSAKDVVFFSEPMSLCEDMFSISNDGNSIVIQNISDTDITGVIYIYYKNASEDLYYGGITYRAPVEGGLKAGEIRKISSAHYSQNGSKLVMVNYG